MHTRISGISAFDGVSNDFRGKGIFPDTNPSSSVDVWLAFHTALHFIANLEPVPGRLYNPDCFIEYDRTSNGIRERLTTPKITMKDGYIDIPTAPGLGIEVDEHALNFYAEKKSKAVSVE